jgi:hypothetical protein
MLLHTLANCFQWMLTRLIDGLLPVPVLYDALLDRDQFVVVVAVLVAFVVEANLHALVFSSYSSLREG